MGNLDRILRIVIAIVVVVLYFTHVINGTIAIVGLVLAAIFLGTSFVSFCPLYLPFGIDTREKK